MEKILQPIKNDILLLNQFINDDLKSDVFLINQISQYIIQAGGKRLRPILAILLGNLVGVKNKTLLIKMAAMIEYIHTATLIHDDVVDESGLRRNRPTSNAVFGNAASVLVGDFIYTRAFQLMCQAQSIELLNILADITNKISEGEVLQLLNIGEIIDEAAYFKVIEYKTAKLFEACALCAAILGECDKPTTVALHKFAIYLGNAFQIYDDVLDYSGNQELMGKNIGDDLIEGKVTLPVIYAIAQDKQNRDFLIASIQNPQEINLAKSIDIIKNSGGIAMAQIKAQEYIDLALQELAKLPNNEYAQALQNLASYAINRNK